MLRCAVCNQTINYLNLLYWQTTPEGDVPFCSPDHASVYYHEQRGEPVPEHLSATPPKPARVEPRGWWDGESFTPNPQHDSTTDHE